MEVKNIIGKARRFYLKYLKADLPEGTKLSTFAAIGVGLTVAGGVYKYVKGRQQAKQGNKLLNAQVPNYNIPGEVSSAAAQGLPSEQYAQAQRNIQRQQIISIAGARDRRGGLGAIATTQQATNDADLNLDTRNAQARMNNQRILAGYRDKQWAINSKQPYDRNYNYGMNLLGAGNMNQASGFDQSIAGIGKAVSMIPRTTPTTGNTPDYQYI